MITHKQLPMGLFTIDMLNKGFLHRNNTIQINAFSSLKDITKTVPGTVTPEKRKPCLGMTGLHCKSL
jgi:hypothetical protein